MLRGAARMVVIFFLTTLVGSCVVSAPVAPLPASTSVTSQLAAATQTPLPVETPAPVSREAQPQPRDLHNAWMPLISSPPVPPRVVILMIGDGMGFEVVRAARLYTGAPMSFELMPHRGSMTTHAADASVTDSAAASTAMGTGRKVAVGVISQAIPGGGSDLKTILEELAAEGKRTGLVTTSYLTDATPAGMAAHEPTRDQRAEIAADYLNQTRPNLLLGGGGYSLTLQDAADAGYTTVTDRAGLEALDLDALQYVSGQFSQGSLPYELDGLENFPHLSEMTAAALDLLEEDPHGFFLMVEGGRIDHAAHQNDLPRAVGEVIEFSNAVDVVMQWASTRADTLVIVTADHETGGLRVEEDQGPGQYPTVSWKGSSHTGVPVPIYAAGAHADRVWGRLDNTEIRSVIYGQRVALKTKIMLPMMER